MRAEDGGKSNCAQGVTVLNEFPITKLVVILHVLVRIVCLNFLESVWREVNTHFSRYVHYTSQAFPARHMSASSFAKKLEMVEDERGVSRVNVATVEYDRFFDDQSSAQGQTSVLEPNLWRSYVDVLESRVELAKHELGGLTLDDSVLKENTLAWSSNLVTARKICDTIPECGVVVFEKKLASTGGSGWRFIHADWLNNFYYGGFDELFPDEETAQFRFGSYGNVMQFLHNGAGGADAVRVFFMESISRFLQVEELRVYKNILEEDAAWDMVLSFPELKKKWFHSLRLLFYRGSPEEPGIIYSGRTATEQGISAWYGNEAQNKRGAYEASPAYELLKAQPMLARITSFIR